MPKPDLTLTGRCKKDGKACLGNITDCHLYPDKVQPFAAKNCAYYRRLKAKTCLNCEFLYPPHPVNPPICNNCKRNGFLRDNWKACEGWLP